MKTNRTADQQKFWDRIFAIAYQDALTKNHGRSEVSRINLAQARADGALDARRRSAKGPQR